MFIMFQDLRRDDNITNSLKKKKTVRPFQHVHERFVNALLFTSKCVVNTMISERMRNNIDETTRKLVKSMKLKKKIYSMFYFYGFAQFTHIQDV